MFKGSKKKHLDHYSFFYLGPQVIYILKNSKKNHLNDFFLVLFWGLALQSLQALITNLLSNKLFSCIPFLLECITFNGSNQKVSQLTIPFFSHIEYLILFPNFFRYLTASNILHILIYCHIFIFMHTILFHPFVITSLPSYCPFPLCA